jgi:hypothetical protein
MTEADRTAMTVADWLACADPQKMLAFLGGKVSDRKLRLFSAACCRHIWALLDPIGKQAVECAEQYADGAETAGEQAKVENLAWWGADALNYEEDSIWLAGWAAHGTLEGDGSETPALAARAVGDQSEPTYQCQLLRDIVGNPFRPVSPDPAWLTWHGGAVRQLVSAVYEERELPSGHLDAARLVVLADMLEEVGCTDADVLGHLRGPGVHVRGCWAIDLLTGRG